MSSPKFQSMKVFITQSNAQISSQHFVRNINFRNTKLPYAKKDFNDRLVFNRRHAENTLDTLSRAFCGHPTIFKRHVCADICVAYFLVWFCMRTHICVYVCIYASVYGLCMHVSELSTATFKRQSPVSMMSYFSEQEVIL